MECLIVSVIMAKQIEKIRIATPDDIKQVFSDTMFDTGYGIKDRLRAAEDLAKIYGMFTENINQKHDFGDMGAAIVRELSRARNDRDNA